MAPRPREGALYPASIPACLVRRGTGPGGFSVRFVPTPPGQPQCTPCALTCRVRSHAHTFFLAARAPFERYLSAASRAFRTGGGSDAVRQRQKIPAWTFGKELTSRIGCVRGKRASPRIRRPSSQLTCRIGCVRGKRASPRSRRPPKAALIRFGRMPGSQRRGSTPDGHQNSH